MDDRPYRSPARRRTTAPAPDDTARLGALRSVHRPPPLTRSLAFVALISIVPLCLAVVAESPAHRAVAIALIGVVWIMVLGSRWPLRGARIELYTDGVVVITARGRNVIAFEDVDTVWLDLDVTSSSFGKIARIQGVRLVDHDGVTHRVPSGVEGSPTVTNWIFRQCSDPLMADAEAAMKAGEHMTFGEIQIDEVGIRFGAGERAPWTEIRLVRFQPGSVSFFRRMPIIPWRTIRLDRVPHPTIFTRLVRGLARQVEVDDLRAKFQA